MQLHLDLQWILSPLTQYAMLALGLLACLIFFVSLKLEVHRVRAQAAKASEAARSDCDTLSRELETVRQGLREIETSPASALPAGSLNLTRRAQALRMHRRGEEISTIAGALQVPQNEIRLLLKVQELASR